MDTEDGTVSFKRTSTFSLDPTTMTLSFNGTPVDLPFTSAFGTGAAPFLFDLARIGGSWPSRASSFGFHFK
jgi:hypothetical protein